MLLCSFPFSVGSAMDERSFYLVKPNLILPRKWPRPALLPLLGIALVISIPGAEAATFTNSTAISIPAVGPGIPFPAGLYPSRIFVSGLSGQIASVSASLVQLRHTFPSALDVLLVGPGGESVLLMSDAGAASISGVNLSFSDSSTAFLPSTGTIVSGTYHPTDHGTAPDPFLSPAPPGPYPTDLKVFDGTDPNGLWSLYVVSDATSNGGAVSNGWRLNLTTLGPPVIIKQPQSLTAAPGNTAFFRVEVAIQPAFAYQYQWRRNGQVIPGQNSDTLVIPSVSAAQAGDYSVVVSNAANRTSTTSSDARLTVSQVAPLIIVDPLPDLASDPNEDVVFEARTVGTPPLRYQWTLNGMALPNETNSILRLTKVQALSGGAFAAIIWNDTEATKTRQALLLVRAATGPEPTDDFADRPLLRDLFSGVLQTDSSRFSRQPGELVLKGGGQTAWFEWEAPADGILTLSSRGSSFDTMMSVFTGPAVSELRLVTRDDDRAGFYTSALKLNARKGVRYQIQVDGFGLKGDGGPFTVSWFLESTEDRVPVIVENPVSQAVLPGKIAQFQVVADSQEVEYQWFFQGIPLSNATEDTLIINDVNSRNVGMYAVRLRDPRSGRVVFSEPVDLQISSVAGKLVYDKYENMLLNSPAGNGPNQGLSDDLFFSPASGGGLDAGFISIGLGDSFYHVVQSTYNTQKKDPTPCGSPFVGTLWQGVTATNTGAIQVHTIGSEIPARLAVYQLTGGLSDLTTPPIVCDLSSASNGLPCVAQFAASEGIDYTVVAEGYQASGNLQITCTMGVAPPLTNAIQHCLVASNGAIELSMPATNWFPPPFCQWRFQGVNLPNETNATLVVTNFTEDDVGTYSVWVSNFVSQTSRDVAELAMAPPFVLQHSWCTNAAGVSWTITASNGAPFVLQTTTVLEGPWLPVATNSDPCLILFFTNSTAFVDPQRYYRAAPWSPP
jgi:hypothetical protein